jgi:hypothetical protein
MASKRQRGKIRVEWGLFFLEWSYLYRCSSFAAMYVLSKGNADESSPSPAVEDGRLSRVRMQVSY